MTYGTQLLPKAVLHTCFILGLEAGTILVNKIIKNKYTLNSGYLPPFLYTDE